MVNPNQNIKSQKKEKQKPPKIADECVSRSTFFVMLMHTTGGFIVFYKQNDDKRKQKTHTNLNKFLL